MLNLEPPSVPKKDKSDTYGSVLREELKRSMEEPYRPLNKREPRDVPTSLLIAVIFGVIALGMVAVFAFDRFEGLFR